MYIEMHRGDYKPLKFPVTNSNGKQLDLDFDEIYITFKRNNRIKEEVLFQKRLSTGEITKDENGYYHFAIMPEDTENLSYYDKYCFDIEVYKENPLIKQTRLGVLNLTEETTHKENEV